MTSDTPRTVAVCEKLIAWATKNPNATIGDAAKFIVETFTEDMAEVERELNEAQKTITEFREWSIGGVAASEWKNRAETAEAKLAALQAMPDVAGLVEATDNWLAGHAGDSAVTLLPRLRDALLSLSAQLAEKEAECNAKTEVLLEAQRIAAQAQAECEGLRRDAERWRFLRDEEYDEHLLNYLVAPKIHRDSVDAAIDSARKEST